VTEIPDDLACPMERARIERVFSNLFENAIDAMRSGGRVVIQSQVEGENILVRVDDTGPGINPALRGRLFQPFVTAGKKNGLGLGLALSRQAMLDHGGDMWADATGPGARFYLRLPKERVGDPITAGASRGIGSGD
jgi:signal transduction histidine kinase